MRRGVRLAGLNVCGIDSSRFVSGMINFGLIAAPGLNVYRLFSPVVREPVGSLVASQIAGEPSDPLRALFLAARQRHDTSKRLLVVSTSVCHGNLRVRH